MYGSVARQSTLWRPTIDTLQVRPSDVAAYLVSAENSPNLFFLQKGTPVGIDSDGFLKIAANAEETVGLSMETATYIPLSRITDQDGVYVSYCLPPNKMSVSNLPLAVPRLVGHKLYVGENGLLADEPLTPGDKSIAFVRAKPPYQYYSQLEIMLHRYR